MIQPYIKFFVCFFLTKAPEVINKKFYKPSKGGLISTNRPKQKRKKYLVCKALAKYEFQYACSPELEYNGIHTIMWQAAFNVAIAREKISPLKFYNPEKEERPSNLILFYRYQSQLKEIIKQDLDADTMLVGPSQYPEDKHKGLCYSKPIKQPIILCKYLKNFELAYQNNKNKLLDKKFMKEWEMFYFHYKDKHKLTNQDFGIREDLRSTLVRTILKNNDHSREFIWYILELEKRNK